MWSGLVQNVEEKSLQGLFGRKFKFIIDSVGRRVSHQEQLHVIEMFKRFSFRDEDVELDNPELIFRVIENWATGHQYFGL